MGRIGEPLLSSSTAPSKNSISAGILREFKTNLLFFPNAILSFKTKCLLDLLWILPPALSDRRAVVQREGCSCSYPLEPSQTKPWLSSRVPPTQTIPSFYDFIALTASAGLSVISSLFSSPKAFSKLLFNSKFLLILYCMCLSHISSPPCMPVPRGAWQWCSEWNSREKSLIPPALDPGLLMPCRQGLPARSVQGPWSLQGSGRRTASARHSPGPVQSPPFPRKPFLCPAEICQKWGRPGREATV